jgi:ferrous iron transport protein B
MSESQSPPTQPAAPPPCVLLMGNPNVGKSAVFSRLTGANVIASNYPGTTVGFTEGTTRLNGVPCRVVDVPGVYTLDPTSRAEEVAVEMLRDGDVIVDVVDATNLERNLNLTLQLMKHGAPMVVALNMWDEAEEHGVLIDAEQLEELLGLPVVPTCAISGEGMRTLQQRLADARSGKLDYEGSERWQVVGGIVERVQRVEHRHPTLRQRFGHASVHPVTGPVIAVVILFVCFEAVRLVGEGLIAHLLDPVFERLWLPVAARLSAALGSAGLLHNLLVGTLIDGELSLDQSLGLLTTGLYIPLGQVLPYVLAFYLVLGILEDTGYLPRLGVLVDNIMHRVGLHGLSIVPMMLGLGCNVPGALALRVLETRKERFIGATLMAICVPCMAQTAMVAALLGPFGALAFVPVFGTLFVLWLGLGMALKRFTSGTTPEILVDIPPYRMPYAAALAKKLWMRMRWFTAEAVPYVLAGVLVVNILHISGLLAALARLIGPVIEPFLGLPSEAVVGLAAGLMRKDVAVGMLAPLGLSMKQLIVASVVLTAYFPCAATFVVLLRELGWRDTARSAAIMLVTAFATGTVLNVVLTGIGL